MPFAIAKPAICHCPAGRLQERPYDEDVLAMVVTRVQEIQRSVPVPFLLENNVHYVDIRDQDMSEPQFLNQLAQRTGCGLLLDLHNLYVNALNHGFDPYRFLGKLELNSVVEIHIAGGNELAGMYTDSHAGPCPQPVWDMLNYVTPRTPRLCGITFEFHESYYPLLKEEGILNQLRSAREAWRRRP